MSRLREKVGRVEKLIARIGSIIEGDSQSTDKPSPESTRAVVRMLREAADKCTAFERDLGLRIEGTEAIAGNVEPSR